MEKWTNNAASSLASSLTNVATTLSVVASEGSKFPALEDGDYFYVTITAGGLYEIVLVTARSADVFTIVRAQQGTVAQAWSAGAKVELRPTKGSLEGLRLPTWRGLLGDAGIATESGTALVGGASRIELALVIALDEVRTVDGLNRVLFANTDGFSTSGLIVSMTTEALFLSVGNGSAFTTAPVCYWDRGIAPDGLVFIYVTTYTGGATAYVNGQSFNSVSFSGNYSAGASSGIFGSDVFSGNTAVGVTFFSAGYLGDNASTTSVDEAKEMYRYVLQNGGHLPAHRFTSRWNFTVPPSLSAAPATIRDQIGVVDLNGSATSARNVTPVPLQTINVLDPTSYHTASGSIAYSRSQISATTSFVTAVPLIGVRPSATPGNPITVNLPDIAQVPVGAVMMVKDENGNAVTNNITIDAFGSQTIDGSLTLVLNSARAKAILYSDGANWQRLV